MDAEEEQSIQNLRSKATELLLREEFKDSIQAYSQIINLCQHTISTKNLNADSLHKSLCVAYSNRAEARARLLELSDALQDCEEALRIERSHFKTLLCKGKILLTLNRYSAAWDCFKAASLDPEAIENSDLVNGLLAKSKRMEFLSRSGRFDVSDWVSGGFRGRMPEFAEYIGAVEIKKSEISGRGLFATKNVEIGTLLFVTKAVAVDRAIMPQDCGENDHLVVWKNFIDRVVGSASKCHEINYFISILSAGEDEEVLEVPDIGIFRPESEVTICGVHKLDKSRLMSILDVNCIVEDAISAKVLGKNADYQGIGLWILASLMNHSCDPNARRVHIGDHVAVHAARDVKAGEELTFAYFDVLSPLNSRRETAKNWGFRCECKRCKFEECVMERQEMREIEMALRKGVVDMGNVVYRLEEGMRKWMVRGKGKGYLRGSFWEAYSRIFGCEKVMRKWGRKIPSSEVVVDSVFDAVGGDDRILKVFLEGLKIGGINGVLEMEKAIKFGRGIFGKLFKKQLRKLIHFDGAVQQ